LVPRSACDEVLDEGRRALDTWRRRQRVPVADHVWDDLGTFNQCVEVEERLWATVLGPPMGDPRASTLAGRFKLVFVGRDGTRSEAWPAVEDMGERFVLGARETSWRQGEGLRTRLGPTRLFDYDGDGCPEFVGAVHEHLAEGETITRVIVWRATATRLEPFEPAMGLHPVGVEDFDGDGRPDLRTHAELLVLDDARPDRPLRGPALYARSLPGGLFALSSGAALIRNRALCPVAPTPPMVLRGAGGVDVRASVERVACAVLWRVPPSVLEAALRRECPLQSDGGSTPCAPGATALMAMARMTPLADLRAAVSFVVRGASGAARSWYAVLEGTEHASVPVALGTIEGECDVMEGEGRGGELAFLRCWAATEGVEVRVLRLGTTLVFQRRALHRGGPVGPYTEIRRVTVPASLVLRAGSILDGE
jgi:hypothetical protein